MTLEEFRQALINRVPHGECINRPPEMWSVIKRLTQPDVTQGYRADIAQGAREYFAEQYFNDTEEMQARFLELLMRTRLLVYSIQLREPIINAIHAEVFRNKLSSPIINLAQLVFFETSNLRIDTAYFGVNTQSASEFGPLKRYKPCTWAVRRANDWIIQVRKSKKTKESYAFLRAAYKYVPAYMYDREQFIQDLYQYSKECFPSLEEREKIFKELEVEKLLRLKKISKVGVRGLKFLLLR